MAAYECISGIVTAAGAVLQNWAMNDADRLTVRETPGTPYLLNAWTDTVAPGILEITSARLHDIGNGMSYGCFGVGDPLRTITHMEKLYSGDVLRVRQSGSPGVGDIDSGTLCLYYDSLPGLDQNLISFAEFKRRYVRSMSPAANVTPVMIGGYSPNVGGGPGGNPNFKANTMYAVMGMTNNDLPVGTITYKGPDTCSLRIPLPRCNDSLHFACEWFLRLAQQFPDRPMIPVFNSENRNNTFVESVHSSIIVPAGTVYFQLAQLS